MDKEAMSRVNVLFNVLALCKPNTNLKLPGHNLLKYEYYSALILYLILREIEAERERKRKEEKERKREEGERKKERERERERKKER